MRNWSKDARDFFTMSPSYYRCLYLFASQQRRAEASGAATRHGAAAAAAVRLAAMTADSGI